MGISPGGRKVAIKVVHSHDANDPEFRRRFAREVDAARQVGGFHTAAVVGADPHADPPWMATAYIPGPSLAEAIAQRGPLDEAGVSELGAVLAEGLEAIHACGLIHRDLKPSNIILAEDGPRIIDFGIAKSVDVTTLTGSNAVIGTIPYMSPEQLQGEELTPHSDVFALGTVLAHAATGHNPFEAPTIPALITRILRDPPSLDPLAGGLRDIIADCLSKQPGSRPGTADLLSLFSTPRFSSRPAKGSLPDLAPREIALPTPDAPPTNTITQESPAAPGPLPGILVHADMNITPPQAGPITQSPSASPGQARQGGSPTRRDQPHHGGHRRRLALIATGTTAAVALAILGFLLDKQPASLDKHPASTFRTTLTATLTDPNNGPSFGSVASGSVAFGPGGILATADPDTGNSYLWNTATRHIIATLTGTSTGTVDSVAFGPGGILATADDNGNTYLWKITYHQS